MVYLWIALGLWLLPAAIVGVALTVVVMKDKLKDKSYRYLMAWWMFSLLVALGTLAAILLVG
jgi:hypothetical protein